MFKNKILEMKLVDPRKADQPQLNAAPTNAPETVIIEVVRESSKYAAGLVAAYMAADALRQIAIYTAMTKIK